MKKRLILFFTLLLSAFVFLAACSNGMDAPSWQEQYDLGVRYLSEGNYAEAIIAFTAAIDIDPRQVDAYEKAAEVYRAMGDEESARAILEQGISVVESDRLLRLLEDLNKPQELSGVPMEGTEVQSEGLSLSNFTYVFREGGSAVENNEGAVGGMKLSFTVDEPEGVQDVLIASWRQGGFFAGEIEAEVAQMVDIWRDDYPFQDKGIHVPFQSGGLFPVYPEDRGTVVDVLMIGLDKDGNALGYSVVAVEIP